MAAWFGAVTRREGQSFYSTRSFWVDMRGVLLPVFSQGISTTFLFCWKPPQMVVDSSDL
jgi:hypothetical protein